MDMTIDQIKAELKAKGIPFKAKMRKAELLGLLENAAPVVEVSPSEEAEALAIVEDIPEPTPEPQVSPVLAARIDKLLRSVRKCRKVAANPDAPKRYRRWAADREAKLRSLGYTG